jgi:hypothetical protein
MNSAVLIGGYKDMDERAALDSIKRLKPPDKKHLLDVLTVTGQAKAEDGKTPPKRARTGQFVNPFVNSFVAQPNRAPGETGPGPTRADKLLRVEHRPAVQPHGQPTPVDPGRQGVPGCVGDSVEGIVELVLPGHARFRQEVG